MFLSNFLFVGFLNLSRATDTINFWNLTYKSDKSVCKEAVLKYIKERSEKVVCDCLLDVYDETKSCFIVFEFLTFMHIYKIIDETQIEYKGKECWNKKTPLSLYEKLAQILKHAEKDNVIISFCNCIRNTEEHRSSYVYLPKQITAQWISNEWETRDDNCLIIKTKPNDKLCSCIRRKLLENLQNEVVSYLVENTEKEEDIFMACQENLDGNEIYKEKIESLKDVLIQFPNEPYFWNLFHYLFNDKQIGSNFYASILALKIGNKKECLRTIRICKKIQKYVHNEVKEKWHNKFLKIFPDAIDVLFYFMQKKENYKLVENISILFLRDCRDTICEKITKLIKSNVCDLLDEADSFFTFISEDKSQLEQLCNYKFISLAELLVINKNLNSRLVAKENKLCLHFQNKLILIQATIVLQPVILL